jgi:hypothetical protein
MTAELSHNRSALSSSWHRCQDSRTETAVGYEYWLMSAKLKRYDCQHVIELHACGTWPIRSMYWPGHFAFKDSAHFVIHVCWSTREERYTGNMNMWLNCEDLDGISITHICSVIQNLICCSRNHVKMGRNEQWMLVHFLFSHIYVILVIMEMNHSWYWRENVRDISKCETVCLESTFNSVLNLRKSCAN